MKNLIIDGKDLGTTLGPRQDREKRRWVFLMQAGYYISIEFDNIKYFDSCDNFDIITFNAE